MLRKIADLLKIDRHIKVWDLVPVSDDTIETILNVSGIEKKKNNDLKVLDFGCGSGRYLDAFAEFFQAENMVGVDTDPNGIRAAQEKGFNAIKLDEDKAKLPFENESFDFIFSSNVIEHIPFELYLQYIKELKRTLKNDGILFIGAPNYPFKRFYDMKRALFTSGKERLYYLFDDPTHCNCQSVLTVEKQFAEEFKNVRFYATDIFFERYLRFPKRPYFKNKLRVLGNKFIGVCSKV